MALGGASGQSEGHSAGSCWAAARLPAASPTAAPLGARHTPAAREQTPRREDRNRAVRGTPSTPRRDARGSQRPEGVALGGALRLWEAARPRDPLPLWARGPSAQIFIFLLLSTNWSLTTVISLGVKPPCVSSSHSLGGSSITRTAGGEPPGEASRRGGAGAPAQGGRRGGRAVAQWSPRRGDVGAGAPSATHPLGHCPHHGPAAHAGLRPGPGGASLQRSPTEPSSGAAAVPVPQRDTPQRT